MQDYGLKYIKCQKGDHTFWQWVSRNMTLCEDRKGVTLMAKLDLRGRIVLVCDILITDESVGDFAHHDIDAPLTPHLTLNVIEKEMPGGKNQDISEEVMQRTLTDLYTILQTDGFTSIREIHKILQLDEVALQNYLCQVDKAIRNDKAKQRKLEEAAA